ncbi:MAG: hypothetical protein IT330_10410 [Anaerolineae bacterium]|nr:hypothetical protein [Anaerolineae bacterium]
MTRALISSREIVSLSSSAVTADLVPAWGAKMTSLRLHTPAYEFFAPAARPLGPPDATQYRDRDAYGFDEMFPTLEPCAYPESPWAGLPLGDHGDVWAIGWNWHKEVDALILECEDGRFPYRLRKRLRFVAPNRLRTDYSVENLGESPLRGLWAAHVLVPMTDAVRLTLPANVPYRRTYISGSDIFAPRLEQTDAAPYLTDMSAFPVHGVAKYLTASPVKEGYCAWTDVVAKVRLELRWPATEVPYLDIWYNRGGWPGPGGLRHIGLEPISAPGDRLSDYGPEQVMVVPAHGTRRWWLEMAVSTL